HLGQRVQAAQPRLVKTGELAVVRFDGTDDWLGLSGLKRRLDEMTVFVVAAPRSNAGYFRGFLAFNATGENDYVTGFNLDMSGLRSDRFTFINVEGPGFGGAVNLMRGAHPFGEFHTLEVHARSMAKRIDLLIDGTAAGQRPWQPAVLRMDEVSLGA